MLGALTVGPFAKYGRRKIIILTTILLTIGSLLSLIPNFFMFSLGRFTYGVACGYYFVLCPKYIEETCPLEIKGPIGGLTQVSICFGILIPFTIGMIYGDS